jgi:hypothetical protein
MAPLIIFALSGPAWAAIAATVGPLLGAVTWFVARRHREQSEDSDSMSRAVTAVTDANVALTAAASSLLGPLQARISDLEEANATLLAAFETAMTEQEGFRNEMAQVQSKMRVVVDYVHTLRHQIVQLGAEPVDFPDDLDGFSFD